MSTTPESIVVSLENAKQLKEAGWPQSESVWYWIQNVFRDQEKWVIGEPGAFYKLRFAAPAAEEILRKLPDHIPWNGRTVPLLVSYRAWSSRGWNVRYATGLRYGDEQAEVVSGDTLANAAASMWLYLKQNNLLPPT